MKNLLTALLIVCTFLGTSDLFAKSRPPLYGMVVVIDPGHGGIDPGSSGFFNNGKRVRVVEDEYVADVSRRLVKLVRANGAIVITTTYDTKQSRPINEGQHNAISHDTNERYTLTGKQVRSGKNRYLRPRTTVGNAQLRKYPKHRIVFLSVHFDSTGNKKLEGVHIIAPSGKTPALVSFLESEFRKAHRLRTLNGKEYHPVMINGTVRNLFVLKRKNNKISQRTLIELGNFSNKKDVWRIRSSKVRQEYAQIMLRALIKTNGISPSLAR